MQGRLCWKATPQEQEAQGGMLPPLGETLRGESFCPRIPRVSEKPREPHPGVSPGASVPKSA